MSLATHKRETAKRIRRANCAPINAVYDPAGNCLFCGECGRCPGVHALEEIRKIIKGTVPDVYDIPF